MDLKKTFTPGDVVYVRCKTHGRQTFIAGIDFPVDQPAPTDCPYCRLTKSGKPMCGQGFIDHLGVAYVVDVHGNLRKLDKLSPQQVKRIQGRRDLLRGKGK